MNPYYIWYEIYENGRPIKNNKNRYFRPYKYKANAERRARQMWSSDVYDPNTNALIERKWIVSQTCPWEDVYIFETRADAENILNAARMVAQRYDYVSRADVNELVNKKTPAYNFIDTHYGWMEKHLKQASVYCALSVYVLELPKALPVDI